MEFVLACALNGTPNNEAQIEWRICSLLLLFVFVSLFIGPVNHYATRHPLVSAEILFILFGSHAGRPSLNRNG